MVDEGGSPATMTDRIRSLASAGMQAAFGFPNPATGQLTRSRAALAAGLGPAATPSSVVTPPPKRVCPQMASVPQPPIVGVERASGARQAPPPVPVQQAPPAPVGLLPRLRAPGAPPPPPRPPTPPADDLPSGLMRVLGRGSGPDVGQPAPGVVWEPADKTAAAGDRPVAGPRMAWECVACGVRQSSALPAQSLAHVNACSLRLATQLEAVQQQLEVHTVAAVAGGATAGPPHTVTISDDDNDSAAPAPGHGTQHGQAARRVLMTVGSVVVRHDTHTPASMNALLLAALLRVPVSVASDPAVVEAVVNAAGLQTLGVDGPRAQAAIRTGQVADLQVFSPHPASMGGVAVMAAWRTLLEAVENAYGPRSALEEEMLRAAGPALLEGVFVEAVEAAVHAGYTGTAAGDWAIGATFRFVSAALTDWAAAATQALKTEFITVRRQSGPTAAAALIPELEAYSLPSLVFLLESRARPVPPPRPTPPPAAGRTPGPRPGGPAAAPGGPKPPAVAITASNLPPDLQALRKAPPTTMQEAMRAVPALRQYTLNGREVCRTDAIWGSCTKPACPYAHISKAADGKPPSQ
jgi:hypothetical protein